MTHKYLYIDESGVQLGASTKFYVVSIGTGKQANRDYLFLIAYSQDKGHFFERWKDGTAEFLNKCLLSCSDITPHVTKINARDLVRNFKNNLSQSMSQNSILNDTHLKKMLDCSYRISSNLNAKNAD